jgi:hypothetical protein
MTNGQGSNFDAAGNRRSGGNGRPRGVPAGLSASDEAELLSLVEGELSPDQERAVIRRWQGRPEVIRLIEGMVKDRTQLGSLPVLSAPVGLLDGVEALLERESLLGGDNGSEFASGVEHGTLVSNRPPTVDIGSRWSISRVLRYSGMAAGLVLAAGVTFMVMRGGGLPAPTVQPSITDATSPNDGEQIAMNNTPSGPANGELPPSISSKHGAEHGETGQREAAKQESGSTMIAAAPDAREQAGAASAALMKVDVGLSSERALELAREGRLMIRVVTGSVDQTLAKVRDGNDRRLADVVTGVRTTPSDVERIASVAETMRPLSHRRDMELADAFDTRSRHIIPAMSAQDVVTRDRTVQALELVRPEFSNLSTRQQTRRAVARVDIDAEAGAIESFQKAMASKGGVVVELVELPEPMTTEATFNPDEVLWWTQPPSNWAPKVGVPVVFEVP